MTAALPQLTGFHLQRHQAHSAWPLARPEITVGMRYIKTGWTQYLKVHSCSQFCPKLGWVTIRCSKNVVIRNVKASISQTSISQLFYVFCTLTNIIFGNKLEKTRNNAKQVSSSDSTITLQCNSGLRSILNQCAVGNRVSRSIVSRPDSLEHSGVIIAPVTSNFWAQVILSPDPPTSAS